ncbi:acyl-CoA dehydrogenase, partial [Corallococcus llansteffanensis]
MDFSLSPEIEDYRLRVRAFVEQHVLPLETQPDAFDAHENLREEVVARVRARARAEGLWAF